MTDISLPRHRVYACSVCLRRVYADDGACECGNVYTVEVVTDYPAEPFRDCYVLPVLSHESRPRTEGSLRWLAPTD